MRNTNRLGRPTGAWAILQQIGGQMSQQDQFAACTHPSILPVQQLSRLVLERARLENSHTRGRPIDQARCRMRIREITGSLNADARARAQEQAQRRATHGARTAEHTACGCRGRAALTSEVQSLTAAVGRHGAALLTMRSQLEAAGFQVPTPTPRCPMQFLTPDGRLVEI